MRLTLQWFGSVLLWMATSTAAMAFDHTHGTWTGLLQQHVHWTADGHASEVDYAGLAADRGTLQTYLADLSAVPKATFAGWPRAERIAFLINAYNAYTVELILTRYPDVESIKDLGGWLSSPWKQKFFSLLGRKRSLDDVEHGLLRGAPDFAEPRIHFAVNCASVGCPALRPEAYVGDRLGEQLDDQTRRFLTDRQRNRWNGGSLEVSKLFDWYADDFVATGSSLAAPHAFLAVHAEWLSDQPAQQAALQRGEVELEFTAYDWTLNRVRP